MQSHKYKHINVGRLRMLFALFFITLSLPTAFLINHSISQLKWEAFHQYRLQAQDFTNQISTTLHSFIDTEEARSFVDYSFLVVEGGQKSNFLQRSPLSQFPNENQFPGIIGYFQVDTDGDFSTPILPNDLNSNLYGLTDQQITERQGASEKLLKILAENKLIEKDRVIKTVQAGNFEYSTATRGAGAAAPQDDYDFEEDSLSGLLDQSLVASMSAEPEASQPLARSMNEPVVSQQAFDRLKAPQRSRDISNKLGRVDELQLKSDFQQAIQQMPAEAKKKEYATRKQRVERRAQLETKPSSPLLISEPLTTRDLKIKLFASEIDPLEYSLLESGHAVLFRKVWRDGQRIIQGILLQQDEFVDGAIKSAFKDNSLSYMSNLIIAYQDDVFDIVSGTLHSSPIDSSLQLQGELLHQASLPPPFSDYKLIFSITRMPYGTGGNVIAWLTVIITLVLCGGVFFMYRASLNQLRLSQQQQDFVSSVSHELKTPLTSIRMYGEILREGWANEDKKKEYYDFIYDESERLSRLIANVLQLARMNRNDLICTPKPVSCSELKDLIQSKIQSQIERAGFDFTIAIDDKCKETSINIDTDLFVQIVINLIDNAIKFSAKSSVKKIDFTISDNLSGDIVFSVRDYGPGIAKKQLKNIFKLFYRLENELTRETSGTGIGLALVHRLTDVMHGKIDVVNQEPGTEFRLRFPIYHP